jgi:hypothetical protein
MGELKRFVPGGPPPFDPVNRPGLIAAAMTHNACLLMLEQLAGGDIKPKQSLLAYKAQQRRLWDMNEAALGVIRSEFAELDRAAYRDFTVARRWHEATDGVLLLDRVLRP